MEIDIHQLPDKLNLTPKQLVDIVKALAGHINLQADSIACIFVDDEYLADMHGRYLDDPDKTDVITFDLGEQAIQGEIYISYQRAVEQAALFQVTYEAEVIRLIIHGLLHLAGYDDIEEADRIEMKRLENDLLDKYFPDR